MEELKFEAIELPLWGKIVGILLNLLVVVLNSIEIHILRTTVKKRFYESILLSLTVSDLINGLFGFSAVALLSFFGKKSYYLLFWIIGGYGLSYSALISLMHLIFISLDRLWAVHSPLHHMQYSSKRKRIIALVPSWGIPITCMLASMIFVLFHKLSRESVLLHLENTIYCTVAKAILFADLIFIFAYSVIIWITFSRKTENIQENQKQRGRFSNTLILCMSIVLIFILSTTPFTISFLFNWSRPGWFATLGNVLFTVNAISNSLVFLIQKYRTQRSTLRSMNGRDVSSNSYDTRL